MIPLSNFQLTNLREEGEGEGEGEASEKALPLPSSPLPHSCLSLFTREDHLIHWWRELSHSTRISVEGINLRMSTGRVSRVSRQDIQLVKNLIERCLQLYMNEKEVVETLLMQAKIEPGFTELVWQTLEEENIEFFQAYYLRLRLKHQIMEFNKLLEQQLQLTRQMYPTNGTHIPHLHQNSACNASDFNTTQLKLENIHHSVVSGLSNVLTNRVSSLHSMHTDVEMSGHANRIDASPNIISSQSSNRRGLMQGIIKTEVGFSGGSSHMYGTENNLLEAQSAIGAASVTSFSIIESTSQPLHEQLLDADISSFGFLGQIPHNISISDPTAFSQSSDILESYSGSPFLATDGDHFLDGHERGEQGFSYSGVAGEN